MYYALHGVYQLRKPSIESRLFYCSVTSVEMRLTICCLQQIGRRSVSALAQRLSSAEEVDRYAQYHPRILTLERLIDFGRKNASARSSFQFLSNELPVRLANIMKEFSLLPELLITMPSVQEVGNWYEQSFNDVLQFAGRNSNPSDKELNKFNEMLDLMRNRHSTVVETMAQGILEMKKEYGEKAEDAHMAGCIQYFLDRLYASRIGISMIIQHHLMLFGKLPTGERSIGAIDPECDILAVAEDAYENARFLCDQYYSKAPNCEFECQSVLNKSSADRRITMTYIPSHLYHMLFELLKNALRAVVEHHQNRDSLPEVKVFLCQGQRDITIKISDQGGGIRRSELGLLFNYMYSTAPRPDDQSLTPLAGYGYGLPLSRLYARYFNGDLWLNSVDGYGTDAMIGLKTSPKHASELLPIYNRSVSLKYTQPEQVPDWSDVSSSRIMDMH